MIPNTSQAKLEGLLLSGRQHKFPKGQVLQFSDDTMMLSILRSGYVKRYSITNDGTQSIQSIYGPGNVFPLTPVFRALFDLKLYLGQETFYYEAMTPVVLHSVDRTLLETAIADDTDLYKDLLYVCGIRLRSNIQKLENRSLKSASKQLAHQLVFLAQKFGVPEDNNIVIDVPLTHQTLAGLLNLARETVTTNMTRLQEKGLIKSEPKLTIIDIEGLRKAAS
jgi:CRP/FNR family transcriptional regulator